MPKTTLATSLAVGMLMLSSACDHEPTRDDELGAELDSPRRGGSFGYNNDHHAALHLLVGGVGSDPAHSAALSLADIACGDSLPACPVDPTAAGAILATWSP